jgi:hypothetical protein
MLDTVRQWSRFELELTSDIAYGNPLQDVRLVCTFVSDAGEMRRVDGFWDGRQTWRVRFSPNSAGHWRYVTECSDPRDLGLHGRTGAFNCVLAESGSRFQQHGSVEVSTDGRYLTHANGKPFFYLADTGWNGPLFSTDEEWQHYLNVRVQQGFTAVQWVPTQWISAPHGDREGRLPFTGHERIAVNPDVFQRLDLKLNEMNEAGLLGVPVLLWAANWADFEVMRVNPGLTLPEDQAVLLARYMVARWGANQVLWILPGDADYRGANAERWRRIGRAIFEGRDHAPVTLHPNGMSWYADEFRDESWLSLWGYQGCHFGDENALRWAVFGPQTSEWYRSPPRPIINLEPPYENHVDISDHAHRFSADEVRRAIYWSLLVSPTAGVTYGGHGVWGWDDGTSPPTAHPDSGIPLPWREALHMPAAEQLRHLNTLFQSMKWWTLEPDSSLIKVQPGDIAPQRFIAAVRSQSGDIALVYIPEDRRVTLDQSNLKPDLTSQWFNPRTGEFSRATAEQDEFQTPGEGDWVLYFA